MKKNPDLTFTFVLLILLSAFNTFAQETNKTEEIQRLITEASNYLDQKKFDEAIEKSSKIIELAPKSGYAFLIRGVAYNDKGLKTKAIEDLSNAILFGLDKKNMLLAYEFRGLLYYQTKKYDEAITDYDFVLSQNAAISSAFAYRGQSYFYKKNYNAAVSDLNKASELKPGEATVRYFLGKSYYNLGNYQKAAETITEVISMLGAKSPTDAYLVRASAFRRLGKNVPAEADEKKFVELGGKLPDKSTIEADTKLFEGDSRETKMIRLTLAIKQDVLEKNFVSAFKNVDELISLSPEKISFRLKGFIFIARAVGYYQNDANDKALADLNEAIKLDETSNLFYSHRAIVYRKIGKIKEAEADEQKARLLKEKEDEQSDKSNGDNR